MKLQKTTSVINPNVYQKICTQEHFMRKFGGFGISVSILNKLVDNNIQIIKIVYLGATTRKYITTTKNFMDSNIKWDNKGDLQHFVKIKEMQEL